MWVSFSKSISQIRDYPSELTVHEFSCYNYEWNYYLKCRGRLVQWKTVRLQIQRSGFASRLRQTIFLSRVFKRTHLDETTIYWWQRRKRRVRHLWTTAVVTTFSVRKGTYLQIGPMTSILVVEWHHTTLLRNSTKKKKLATCGGISRKLNHTAEY